MENSALEGKLRKNCPALDIRQTDNEAKIMTGAKTSTETSRYASTNTFFTYQEIYKLMRTYRRVAAHMKNKGPDVHLQKKSY